MEMEFKKGDIIWSEYEDRDSKKLKHPAIFCNYEGTDFYGIMLTHSKKYPDNIKMERDHFEIWTKLSFKKEIYFVNQLLRKFKDWKPIKIGKLTEDGIYFIEKKLTKKKAITFEDYINKTF
ncbi:hypothetical protein CSA08_01730 [Candidatus Gracilibacteria bacterium]|nr:MAG: hypothetical protein CSA08_01730 [Candidatus Gracilibacteria bacterium]